MRIPLVASLKLGFRLLRGLNDVASAFGSLVIRGFIALVILEAIVGIIFLITHIFKLGIGNSVFYLESLSQKVYAGESFGSLVENFVNTASSLFAVGGVTHR
jgi:hypothetical protein